MLEAHLLRARAGKSSTSSSVLMSSSWSRSTPLYENFLNVRRPFPPSSAMVAVRCAISSRASNRGAEAPDLPTWLWRPLAQSGNGRKLLTRHLHASNALPAHVPSGACARVQDADAAALMPRTMQDNSEPAVSGIAVEQRARAFRRDPARQTRHRRPKFTAQICTCPRQFGTWWSLCGHLTFDSHKRISFKVRCSEPLLLLRTPLCTSKQSQQRPAMGSAGVQATIDPSQEDHPVFEAACPLRRLHQGPQKRRLRSAVKGVLSHLQDLSGDQPQRWNSRRHQHRKIPGTRRNNASMRGTGALVPTPTANSTIRTPTNETRPEAW